MTACPPDQCRPLSRVSDEEVSLAQHVGHDTAVDDRLSWRAADFGAGAVPSGGPGGPPPVKFLAPPVAPHLRKFSAKVIGIRTESLLCISCLFMLSCFVTF